MVLRGVTLAAALGRVPVEASVAVLISAFAVTGDCVEEVILRAFLRLAEALASCLIEVKPAWAFLARALAAAVAGCAKEFEASWAR